MPAASSAVITNTITVVSGTTADTKINGFKSFKHDDAAFTLDELRTTDRAQRHFQVFAPGAVEGDGRANGDVEFQGLRTSLQIAVVYPRMAKLSDLQALMSEDRDLLVKRLAQASNYNQATTRLRRRAITGAQFDYDPDMGAPVLLMDWALEYVPVWT